MLLFLRNFENMLSLRMMKDYFSPTGVGDYKHLRAELGNKPNPRIACYNCEDFNNWGIQVKEETKVLFHL